MSENRNRYSSAPLQNLKQAEKKAKTTANAPQRVPGGAPSAGPMVRSITGLQLMLMIILPVLIVISLFVKNNTLYLAFAGASVICLMIIWLLNAFMPNARATLTIIHIA